MTDLPNPQDVLTILSTTHYTDKLAKNKHLSPPSVRLYDSTINSLHNSFTNIDKCKKILVYDAPNKRTNKKIEYQDNLETYCVKNDIKMVESDGNGLREAVQTGVEMVDTKYIFFLEHDWEISIKEDVRKILKEFEENPTVNYLRFNKRPNIKAGDDNIIAPADSKYIPMSKTSTYSNNPHICRTEKYREWLKIAKPGLHWLRYITPPTRHRTVFWLFREIYLKKNKSKDAIEHILTCFYEKKIQKQGFNDAQSNMGIYLYGEPGEGPFVNHLGE